MAIRLCSGAGAAVGCALSAASGGYAGMGEQCRRAIGTGASPATGIVFGGHASLSAARRAR